MAALSAAQVSVATTATALNTASSDWLHIRVSVPTGGQTVFVGPTGVTTANGYGIAAGTSIDLVLSPGDVLLGIVMATTQTTHVLRV